MAFVVRIPDVVAVVVVDVDVVAAAVVPLPIILAVLYTRRRCIRPRSEAPRLPGRNR